LKVWVEESDGIPTVRAEGEIDLSTVDTLRSAASEVVRSGPQRVIFDLRRVTYIDSSGLGILVATRKRVGAGQHAVTVITDQPAVLQSLEITGLDRILNVKRDVPVAQSRRS